MKNNQTLNIKQQDRYGIIQSAIESGYYDNFTDTVLYDDLKFVEELALKTEMAIYMGTYDSTDNKEISKMVKTIITSVYEQHRLNRYFLNSGSDKEVVDLKKMLNYEIMNTLNNKAISR